ncbi:dCTP deaminase domain-containing protein, partial [Klebsiella pneumoniae]|uniref:dCTP deaminase n=1 Tax=Klebsiella pneumoniae TaxID=573 RepID=UPI003967F806
SRILRNYFAAAIDSLDRSDGFLVVWSGDFCIIPPNSYILGHTVESVNIPDDVLAICTGKSTYARLGAIVNVTPIVP